jgi:hypothetical protein
MRQPAILIVRRQLTVNLLIYVSVNALLVLAWGGSGHGGVPMKHVALNLVISLVVMAIWGARVAVNRCHVRRDHFCCARMQIIPICADRVRHRGAAVPRRTAALCASLWTRGDYVA